jgi:mannose/fructose/N-acetylgalactosamine-specific phosphotransferase system component IIC
VIAWLSVALLGGVVGLDATSFPQVMISRPLVAGALTGALFGRPLEGIAVGFIVEAFALIILPIGAARYPESGTATVAATSACLAAAPQGVTPAYLVLGLAVALAWERVSGATVILQRRNNGQLLIGRGPPTAAQLERKHLAAMSLDFTRGAVVSATGGLIGYGLLRTLGPFWGLADPWTVGLIAVFVAGMVGTAVPLLGGLRARRVALLTGLAAGAAAGFAL